MRESGSQDRGSYSETALGKAGFDSPIMVVPHQERPVTAKQTASKSLQKCKVSSVQKAAQGKYY